VLQLFTVDALGKEARYDELASVTFDFTPPRPVVVGEPTELEPVSPGRGVSFSVPLTEIPTATPRVWAQTLTGGAAQEPRALTALSNGEVVWFFTGSLPASAAEGDYELHLDPLYDEAGNLSDVVPLHRLRFDKTPPLLFDFAPLSTSLRRSDTLEVTFEVTELLAKDPQVRLGEALLTRDGAVRAPRYRYTLDIGTTDIDGLEFIEVTLEDVAHNVTTDRYGVVTVDASAPSVLDAAFLPAVARSGTAAVLTIVVDEPLVQLPGGAPAVLPHFREGNDPGLAYLSSSGFSHSYAVFVGPDTDDGVYVIDQLEVEDVASNRSLVELSDLAAGPPTLVIDKRVPQVVSAAVNATTRSAITGFDELVVTFDTGENLDSIDEGLRVRLGEQALTCGAYQSSSPQYRCTSLITATTPEGTRTVTIETRDAAGNTDTESLPVVIDHSGPVLITGTLTPDLARAGDVVTLTLVANEELAASVTGGPQAQLHFGNDDDPGFLFRTSYGSTYTYQLFVNEAQAEQSYTLTGVTWTDGVGNTSVVTLGVASGGTKSLTIDRSAPAISEVSLSGTRRSAVSGYDDLTVQFNVDEDLSSSGGSLVVSLGDRPFDCEPFAATAPRYTCTAEVLPTDVEGAAVVTIEARDGAGNLAVKGAPFLIDHTPPAPEALLAWRLSPPLASVPYVATAAVLGSRGQLHLQTLEPLSPLNSVVKAVSIDDGTEELFTFRAQNYLPDGTVVSYWDFLAVHVTEGDYRVEAVLRDDVGNAWENVIALPAPGLRVVEAGASPCFVTRDDGSLACTDFDGDGFEGIHAGCLTGTDCNDSVASAYPHAIEIPGDGIDNDCLGDGDLPLDETNTIFVAPTGRVDGAGTRDDPMQTLEGALAVAGTTRFVAAQSGVYLVPARIFVKRGLIGGLDANWARTDAASVVNTPLTLADMSSELVLLSGSTVVFEGIEVNGPNRVLQVSSLATAVISRARITTTDVTATGNATALFYGKGIVLSSVFDAGAGGNDAVEVENSSNVRFVDTEIYANDGKALYPLADTTLVRTRIDSTNDNGIGIIFYTPHVTAISSLIRSGGTGSSGRGVRLYSSGSSFEGHFTTISSLSMNDQVPVTARCVGCLIAKSVSIKETSRYATVGSAYVSSTGCAVTYGGSCTTDAAVLNACDPAWCDESRDNLIEPTALGEPNLELPSDSPLIDQLPTFEALGTSSSAVLDMTGLCRGATGFAPGAYLVP
ncbi:MAG: putative metal-binding motif-containing protein, partial [Myxococcota bacterium]